MGVQDRHSTGEDHPVWSITKISLCWNSSADRASYGKCAGIKSFKAGKEFSCGHRPTNTLLTLGIRYYAEYWELFDKEKKFINSLQWALDINQFWMDLSITWKGSRSRCILMWLQKHCQNITIPVGGIWYIGWVSVSGISQGLFFALSHKADQID